LLDERLLDDVAFALYARCRSIVMVTEGRGICPDCGSDFKVNVDCPGCGRLIDNAEFVGSYRHQDLYGGNGVEYFESYLDMFSAAKEPKERMLLIDQLLHAFHRGALRQANRSIANNLIEGNHIQVTTLLDGLTFSGDPSAETYRSEWQQSRATTMVVRKARVRDGD
jgi:hypothetical protein